MCYSVCERRRVAGVETDRRWLVFAGVLSRVGHVTHDVIANPHLAPHVFTKHLSGTCVEYTHGALLR
jgi:hypothetical protein